MEQRLESCISYAEDDIRGDFLRHLGEIAAGMLHEVRNPLQGFRAFLQNLIYGFLTEDELKSYGPELLHQLDYVDLLLADYLSFSRQSRIEYSKVDPYPLTEECVRLLQGVALLRQIRLKVDLQDKPLATIGLDPSRIRQVLFNIIINSMDAIGKRRENEQGFQGEILLAVGNEDGCVVWTIMDNGCGMSPESIEKVFDNYYTTKKTGTGLGLAISKAIIDAHGGTITVDSHTGVGTVFRVVIPGVR